MSIKAFIVGAATLASVALPGVASAQRYDGYGYGGGYYGAPDRYDGYRDGRYDRRAYERAERHRRHEIERQRRWEWRHRHYDRGYDHYRY